MSNAFTLVIPSFTKKGIIGVGLAETSMNLDFASALFLILSIIKKTCPGATPDRLLFYLLIMSLNLRNHLFLHPAIFLCTIVPRSAQLSEMRYKEDKVCFC
jgi:hypothetical protein